MLGIRFDYHFMYFSLCDSSTCTVWECNRVLKRSLYLLQISCIITCTHSYIYLINTILNLKSHIYMQTCVRARATQRMHARATIKNTTSLSVLSQSGFSMLSPVLWIYEHQSVALPSSFFLLRRLSHYPCLFAFASLFFSLPLIIRFVRQLNYS